MKTTLVAVAVLGLLAACDKQPAAAPPRTNIAINNAALVKPAAPLAKPAALALMEQRHERMEKIGDAMKEVGRELKGSAPDIAVIRRSASTFATLAPRVPSWFPAGTGPDVGKTRAKPAIWEKPEDFAAKARAFKAAAKAFNAAARSGNLAAIKAKVGPLRQSCKACHDSYREED